MFLSKNNKKIIRVSENTEKVHEKKEENGYVKDNGENNLNKENGGNNSKIDLFNTCRYNFYVKHWYKNNINSISEKIWINRLYIYK